MSDVKRYVCFGGCEEHQHGGWIESSDYDALAARLAEAERDAARIEWLASNPRGGQIVVDGKTQDCVFWGISGHPRATLRDAIDAARATDSAPAVTCDHFPGQTACEWCHGTGAIDAPTSADDPSCPDCDGEGHV